MSALVVVVDFVNWCIACAASGSTLPGGVGAAGGVVAATAAAVAATSAASSGPGSGSGSGSGTGSSNGGQQGSRPSTGATHDGRASGSSASRDQGRSSSFDYGDKEEEAEGPDREWGTTVVQHPDGWITIDHPNGVPTANPDYRPQLTPGESGAARNAAIIADPNSPGYPDLPIVTFNHDGTIDTDYGHGYVDHQFVADGYPHVTYNDDGSVTKDFGNGNEYTEDQDPKPYNPKAK